jgi:two-component system, cell cycle sensor histidine kinase and response regulator CckA
MSQKLNTADDRLIYNNEDVVSTILCGKKRILCVDDDKTILQMTMLLLQYLGYEVVVSSSGADAIDLFQSEAKGFDLVITDMKMPGMNGLELSERLLKSKPDIPIVLCTGSTDLIKEEEIKKIGIREIIIKPFSLTRMAVVIDKYLNKQG